MVLNRSWTDFAPTLKLGIKLMRSNVGSWLIVGVANAFIRQFLPSQIERKLSETEKAQYGAPYQTFASRLPLRQWLREVPIDGQPSDVHEIVANYNLWLQQTNLPKLLLYASPGVIIGDEQVAWCREHLSNLTTIGVGSGTHFIQEDHPELIGKSLAAWIVETESAKL